MDQFEMFVKEPEVEKGWKTNLKGVFCAYCGSEVEKIRDTEDVLPHDQNGAKVYQQIIVRCIHCTRKSHVLAHARTTAFCPSCGKLITIDHGCGCSGEGE